MGGHIPLSPDAAEFAEVAQCHMNMHDGATFTANWWGANAPHFACMAQKLESAAQWDCKSENFMAAHSACVAENKKYSGPGSSSSY